MCAVESKWFTVADYIFSLGVNPKDGRYVHALTRAPNLEAAKYVLSKGFSPNAKNDDGESALFFTSTMRSESDTLAIWRLVISRGCKVDALDNRGRLPLSHLASMIGTYKMWYRLADFFAAQLGASQARDQSGMTSLFYAQYDIRTARSLMNAGFDVNAKSKEGTPLLWTMILGIPDTTIGFTGAPRAEWSVRRVIVRELVSRGAKVNFRDKEGDTILDKCLDLKLPDEISDLRRLGGKMGWEIDVGETR